MNGDTTLGGGEAALADVTASGGESAVETDYVDRGLDGASAPVSAYSPAGQIHAAHLIGTSSVLRRPGWQRTTVRVGFLALSALVAAAAIAGAIGGLS